MAQEEKTYEYDFFDRIVSIKIGNKIVESYEYSDDGKTVVYRNGGATKSDRKLVQNIDDFGRRKTLKLYHQSFTSDYVFCFMIRLHK